MSATDIIKGECLCHQTTVTIRNASNYGGQAYCHCRDCQHTSGTPATLNAIVADKDITIEGPLKKYQSLAKSGNTVTRAFCESCGSPIYHHSPLFGDNKAVQTGNFEYFADKPVVLELWTKNRWPVVKAVVGADQHEFA